MLSHFPSSSVAFAWHGGTSRYLAGWSRWLGALLCGVLLAWGSADAARAADSHPQRPNIVLILADDLGWTDLGCMGSRYYETPHIDRLAAQGMTFTSFCVSQNCAPTRAALLSGQYAPRTGVYSVGTLARGKASDRLLVPPENVTRLPLGKVTLAEALHRAGYATGMFGKWHLGDGADYHPARRGFQEAIVTSGAHFDFTTRPPSDVPPGTYLADYLTDRAIDFITRHREEPFFLYLPHFAVHVPLQAKPELIAKYQQKPPAGGHAHPVYAAMIDSLDQSVGRILQTLDDLKLSDRTLVIFTSDNGGVGGYAVPGTTQTKGTTDNAPLREGKGTLYEGGIRVPLLMRWPGHIPPGSRCDAPAAHVDLYPTLLHVADAPAPRDYVLDGLSLHPLWRDPAQRLAREALYWHFPGYLEAYIPEATWRTTPVSVIRAGDYKLLEFLEDGRLELYNLRTDLGERHNLADGQPELARRLRDQLHRWRRQIGAAMPQPKAVP
jgi:arylsulfatase A-like enzyme